MLYYINSFFKHSKTIYCKIVWVDEPSPQELITIYHLPLVDINAFDDKPDTYQSMAFFSYNVRSPVTCQWMSAIGAIDYAYFVFAMSYFSNAIIYLCYAYYGCTWFI